MAFKDEWKDIRDATEGKPDSGDEISAGPINLIAHEVIRQGEMLGNANTTPMAVPDWEQTNPNKSDYIKNRPFYEDDNGNVVKKLDEKFIPDSIARTEDVKKLINEGGGNGSGDTVQTDYLQNDATQPDFLKHRPFYKEKIILTEGKVVVNFVEFEGGGWIDGANMPAGELPNIEVDGILKVFVEVNDGEEISTQTGYFDGWSIMDGEAMPLEFCDGKLWTDGIYDDKLNFGCYEEIGDVTIKIFMENIEKIDKEFLPSDINTVPYFANDGSLLNTPEPSDLPSGPCILYGMLGKAVNIHYFEDRPTLCNVIQREDELTVIHWFEEDEDYLGGMLVRYLVTTNEEVIEDRSISLTNLDELVGAAYDYADTAYTEAVEAKELAGEAYDYAGQAFDVAMSIGEEVGEAYRMAEEAYAAATDDWVLHSFIMMDGPDGNVYQVRIDENGNLTAKIFE